MFSGFQSMSSCTFELQQSNAPTLLATWRSNQIGAGRFGAALAAKVEFAQAAFSSFNGLASGPVRCKGGRALFVWLFAPGLEHDSRAPCLGRSPSSLSDF